jgi:hypothetical protein
VDREPEPAVGEGVGHDPDPLAEADRRPERGVECRGPRELPEPAEQSAGRAANHEDAPAARDPARDRADERRLATSGERGDPRDEVAAPREARARNRAAIAARARRHADRRAELHERLRELAGRLAVRERRGRRPEPLADARSPRVTADGAEPAQDPLDVPIEHRLR